METYNVSGPLWTEGGLDRGHTYREKSVESEEEEGSETYECGGKCM